MVIHNTDCLQIGIDNNASDKPHSTLIQVCTDFIGKRGVGWQLLLCSVYHLTLGEAPKISGKAAVFPLYLLENNSIFHCGPDFETVADNAGILHKLFLFFLGIACDLRDIKGIKGFPKRLPLFQNGKP